MQHIPDIPLRRLFPLNFLVQPSQHISTYRLADTIDSNSLSFENDMFLSIQIPEIIQKKKATLILNNWEECWVELAKICKKSQKSLNWWLGSTIIFLQTLLDSKDNLQKDDSSLQQHLDIEHIYHYPQAPGFKSNQTNQVQTSDLAGAMVFQTNLCRGKLRRIIFKCILYTL